MWLVLEGVLIGVVGIGGFTVGLWYLNRSATGDEAEVEVPGGNTMGRAQPHGR